MRFNFNNNEYDRGTAGERKEENTSAEVYDVAGDGEHKHGFCRAYERIYGA